MATIDMVLWNETDLISPLRQIIRDYADHNEEYNFSCPVCWELDRDNDDILATIFFVHTNRCFGVHLPIPPSLKRHYETVQGMSRETPVQEIPYDNHSFFCDHPSSEEPQLSLVQALRFFNLGVFPIMDGRWTL